MLVSLRTLLLTTAVVGAPLSLSTSAFAGEASQDEAQKSVAWQTDWKQVKQTAARTKKPIFMLFTGSDWCKWCVKLEHEVFDDPYFINRTAGKYVFMLVDRPRRKKLSPELEMQNAKLCDQFNIDGYPTVLIVTPNEDVIGEVGYEKGGGKAFVQELNAVVRHRS
jgi:protein disulfide-isomerase